MKKLIGLTVVGMLLTAFLILEMGFVSVEPSQIIRAAERAQDVKVRLERNKAQVLEMYYIATRDTSTTGLMAYRNKVLVKQDRLFATGRNDILTTFTFNSPLSINEFERFVAKYRIKVDRFAIRAITPNNERMTISGKPSSSELVPRDSLTLMLTHSSSELQGIIECMGVISARFLKKVNDDARVFLADTSVDNAFMENEFRRHIPSLYWYIEENRSK